MVVARPCDIVRSISNPPWEGKCAHSISKRQLLAAKFPVEGIQIAFYLNGLTQPVLSLAELDSKLGPDLSFMQHQEMDTGALATCQRPKGAKTNLTAEITLTVCGGIGMRGVIALATATVA